MFTANEIARLSKPASRRRTGEAHYRAILTDSQVREMRQLYDGWRRDGFMRQGYTALARMFGCHPATARDIVKYRTRR